MTTDETLPPRELDGPAEPHAGRRAEPREARVRIAEYAPFPRGQADEPERLGFTRNVSRGGMCLGVNDPASIGSLIRVSLRGLDGHIERSSVGRVAWCQPARDERFWVGLEVVGEAETAISSAA